jgi:hypothetical protein
MSILCGNAAAATQILEAAQDVVSLDIEAAQGLLRSTWHEVAA